MSEFNSPCVQWLVLLFGFLVIPGHSDFFHKVEIKKPQAGMTRLASWVAYFYELVSRLY